MSVANIISLSVITNIKFQVNFLKECISKIFFLKYTFVWNFITNKMVYVITDGDFFWPTQGLGVPCLGKVSEDSSLSDVYSSLIFKVLWATLRKQDVFI